MAFMYVVTAHAKCAECGAEASADGWTHGIARDELIEQGWEESGEGEEQFCPDCLEEEEHVWEIAMEIARKILERECVD